jgi:acetyltransferase-like isoleucine patch superfamily enzyme
VVDIDEFMALLRETRRRSEADLRQRFNRSLPFADALFDRWERAKALGFGEGASIYDSALVYGDVRVGAKSWIGPNVLLDGSGGALRIGANCSVAGGTHVYSHDTVLWALSGGVLGKRTGSVTIGDCVYIGAQAVILPEVTIGSRCLVAANSMVNADVPDGTIVGGAPAKVIGRVEGAGAEVRLRYDRAGAAPARSGSFDGKAV